MRCTFCFSAFSFRIFLLVDFQSFLFHSFESFKENLQDRCMKLLASVASHTHNNNSLLCNLSFDFSTKPMLNRLLLLLYCFFMFRMEWIKHTGIIINYLQHMLANKFISSTFCAFFVDSTVVFLFYFRFCITKFECAEPNAHSRPK